MQSAPISKGPKTLTPPSKKKGSNGLEEGQRQSDLGWKGWVALRNFMLLAEQPWRASWHTAGSALASSSHPDGMWASNWRLPTHPEGLVCQRHCCMACGSTFGLDVFSLRSFQRCQNVCVPGKFSRSLALTAVQGLSPMTTSWARGLQCIWIFLLVALTPPGSHPPGVRLQCMPLTPRAPRLDVMNWSQLASTASYSANHRQASARSWHFPQ